MLSTIYTPFVGFSDLDTSDAALMADAHATAAEHADRLYRRFQMHALCEWQQPVCDGLWDLPLPDDGPGEDDPTEGPAESNPLPAAPGALVSAAPAVQERASLYRERAAALRYRWAGVPRTACWPVYDAHGRPVVLSSSIDRAVVLQNELEARHA